MATPTPSSTAKTKPHRLPAPALFIGPPSRNASTLSVARPAPKTNPSTRQLESSQPPSPRTGPVRPSQSRQNTSPPITPPRPQQPQSIFDLTRQSPSALRPKASKSSLEAQWSELQRTLNEVEAAAPLPTARPGTGVKGAVFGAGTTVFGAKHAEALRDLREAQIRLAEAWGPVDRGEGMGEKEGKNEGKEEQQGGKDGKGHKKAKESEDRRELGSERAKQERRQRDGEQDLKTAAERRERNEEYFQKVKAGVQDVVAKLDEVSKAMRKVEGEGREIWEDSSLESGSRERVAEATS